MTESDRELPRPDPALERVARAIDEAARQEARDLAAAARLPDPPDRRALDGRMESLWRDLDRRRRRARFFRGLAMFATAAAILLLFVFLRPREEDRGPGGGLLGDHEVEILAPPRSGDWERIEWRGRERPYVLRVLDAEDGRLLLGPVRVEGDGYPLESQAIADWPDAVLVELQWRLPDGTPEQVSREVMLRR